MFDWLTLTLFAITSRALYSIATKVLSRDIKVSAITQSILLTSLAGLISLVISPFIGGISFVGIQKVIYPVLIVVFSQAFGNILFFKGIKNLDAGTSQIAFSSILIWGVILSTSFLNSSFSNSQFAGIILMLFAIIIIQYKGGRLTLNSSVLYIIASASLFAIFQVFSAQVSKSITTGTYLIIAYWGPSILLGLIYFRKTKLEIYSLSDKAKNSAGRVIFASGTSLLYFLFSFLAYKTAPDDGVVVVLLTAQVILSVILGILLLNEKDNTARKLIAAILAFIAGVLIKS